MEDPLFEPILPKQRPTKPTDSWTLASSEDIAELNRKFDALYRHIRVTQAVLGGNWQPWYDRYDAGEFEPPHQCEATYISAVEIDEVFTRIAEQQKIAEQEPPAYGDTDI